MSEKLEKLHETLATLREQLQQTEEIAGPLKSSLTDMIDHIEEEVNAAEKPPAVAELPPRSSVNDRLSEAVLEFEESHPAVAKTLHKLIDALAQIGI